MSVQSRARGGGDNDGCRVGDLVGGKRRPPCALFEVGPLLIGQPPGYAIRWLLPFDPFAHTASAFAIEGSAISRTRAITAGRQACRNIRASLTQCARPRYRIRLSLVDDKSSMACREEWWLDSGKNLRICAQRAAKNGHALSGLHDQLWRICLSGSRRSRQFLAGQNLRPGGIAVFVTVPYRLDAWALDFALRSLGIHTLAVRFCGWTPRARSAQCHLRHHHHTRPPNP